jgi:hypothetical protein
MKNGALLLAFVTACTSQADPSYRGQTMAEIHGSVQADSPVTPPTTLMAVLVWHGRRPNADAKATVDRKQVGTTVPVSGQFPAKFDLKIYTPPAATALFECGAVKIASAGIFAMLQGADLVNYDITDIYGEVKDYQVLYVDADLPPDNACGVAAMTRGYHLFHYETRPAPPGCDPVHPTDACRGPWPYVEVPMSTELTLLLHHEAGNSTPPGPTPPPDAG